MRVLVASLAFAVAALPACAQQADGPGDLTTADAPAPLPEVARVVCEPGGTRVETPTVKPQADGIHLEVANATRLDLALEIGVDRASPVMGTNVPTSEILDLPPGTIWVACRPSRGSGPVSAPPEPIDIVDEDGLWIAGTGKPAHCARSVTGIVDYVPGARGPRLEPVEIVRRDYKERLRPGDVLERVGYPRETTPEVSLVRDGISIAGFEFHDDGHGGWLRETDTWCSDVG